MKWTGIISAAQIVAAAWTPEYSDAVKEILPRLNATQHLKAAAHLATGFEWMLIPGYDAFDICMIGPSDMTEGVRTHVQSWIFVNGTHAKYLGGFNILGGGQVGKRSLKEANKGKNNRYRKQKATPEALESLDYCKQVTPEQVLAAYIDYRGDQKSKNLLSSMNMIELTEEESEIGDSFINFM